MVAQEPSGVSLVAWVVPWSPSRPGVRVLGVAGALRALAIAAALLRRSA
jgi:hypothetical protein